MFTYGHSGINQFSSLKVIAGIISVIVYLRNGAENMSMPWLGPGVHGVNSDGEGCGEWQCTVSGISGWGGKQMEI